ncbi:MAG: PEP-CTERM-box response regulator transcription factor, partial [Candidatus Methylomirabilales bacterium]
MTPDPKHPKLLLVEDDAEIREQMKWALSPEYAVLEAGDRRAALTLFRRQAPRLVVLDLGLPPAADAATEGLAALREMLQLEPGTKVVVVTGNEERAVALEAVQRGACDYVSKPADINSLRVILARAHHMATLEEEWRQSQEIPAEGAFCGVIGRSPVMHRVFDAVRRVAPSPISVLITGESGTGKEVVARAIHALSPKAAKPFVPIHCAAIPETLLESELFGHERGAFTGADRQQKGRLEAAEGGTVLLDEVGEISPAVQVKLLRFLQDRQLERVGGRGQIRVDLRIMAATNRDLRASIAEGRFREDLFYRLSVVEITVPPLRERGEDVLLLARDFATRFGQELNPRVKGLSDEALEAVRAYAWPGNVRELENRINRAVLMAKGPVIQPADLELEWKKPAREAVK